MEEKLLSKIKFKFRAQIVAAVILTTILILTISYSIELNFQKKKILEQMKSSATILAESMEKSITSADIVNDQEKLQDLVAKFNKVQGIEEVYIIDKNFKIIAHPNPNKVGEYYKNRDALDAIQKGVISTEFKKRNLKDKEAEQKKEGEIYDVVTPIHDNEKIVGAIEVELSMAPVNNLQSQIIFRGLLSILANVIAIGIILNYWLFKIVRKPFNESLDEITERLHKTLDSREEVHIGTIQSLLAALNAKDNYTSMHSIRVADYSIRMAKSLGLPKNQIKLIEESALIHDVGKIAVPEKILNKPGTLEKEEYEIIKQHPIVGEQIAKASGILDNVGTIVRHHQERIDGRGYPDKISGDQIPYECQIIAVADVFDALTSDRPYRKAMSIENAIDVLQQLKGSHLNAILVETLIENVIEIN